LSSTTFDQARNFKIASSMCDGRPMRAEHFGQEVLGDQQRIPIRPVAHGITNTYQVGLVRDAIFAPERATMLHKSSTSQGGRDGWLSASESFPLKTEHAFAAFDSAIGGGPIAEGSVGGGTGMICHEFKGGTGTASRVVMEGGARYTVGALVQANYGLRELLRIDGVPVGREIGPDRASPSLWKQGGATQRGGWVNHRRPCHRCTTHPSSVPTSRAPSDNRPCMGGWHREQRQRRPFYRFLDG
jgi:hypothetical protein